MQVPCTHSWYTHGVLVLWLTLCLVVGPGTVRPVKAQTTKSFEIPLEELGYEDRVLRGPLEQVRYYFGLPANWKPQEGGYLALNLDYNDSGQESHAPALLKVRLNGKISYTPHCVDFCQISGQRREVLSNG